MTIAIVNIIFYWPMVIARSVSINFKFFLCQFVAKSILLQVVLHCSRWFQLVPACSSLFLVLVCTGNRRAELN